MRAARLMRGRGVEAIVVLGGDGTHRAVVSALRQCPDRRHLDRHQQCLSRDARADHHRPRGRARGHRPQFRPHVAFAANKRLEVCDQRHMPGYRPCRCRRRAPSASSARGRSWQHRDVPRVVRHLRRSRRHRHVGDRRVAGAGRRARARRPPGELAPARTRATVTSRRRSRRASSRRSASSAGERDRPAGVLASTVQAGSIALDGEREIILLASATRRVDARGRRLPHHRCRRPAWRYAAQATGCCVDTGHVGRLDNAQS